MEEKDHASLAMVEEQFDLCRERYDLQWIGLSCVFNRSLNENINLKYSAMKEIIKIVNDLFNNELNLRTEARGVGDNDTAKTHNTNAFGLLKALGELYDVRDGKSNVRGVDNCNLASVIKWVAVKDKLPKENKMVLCARTETSMNGTKRIASTTGIVKNGRFSCEWDWINVDYWAELPQPPCL